MIMLPVTIFSMCLTAVVVHRVCCFWGVGVSPPVDAATQMGGEYMAPDRVRCHCEAARALPLGLRSILGIESEVAVNGHRGGKNNKGGASYHKEKKDDALGIETFACNTDEGGRMEVTSYAGPVFSRLRGMFDVAVGCGCTELA